MKPRAPGTPPRWLVTVWVFVLAPIVCTAGGAVSWLLYGDVDLLDHPVMVGITALLAIVAGYWGVPSLAWLCDGLRRRR